MREVPRMEQVLQVARELGAVPHSNPPLRAITGVAFTFEQLNAFVNKMINPNALIVDVSEGRSAQSQWEQMQKQTEPKFDMKVETHFAKGVDK